MDLAVTKPTMRALRALCPLALIAGVLASGCGPTRFEAETNIPQPLIAQIPVVVGMYMSPTFREMIHREERWGSRYEIAIGKAQAQGFDRLMHAMFQEVVPVEGTDATYQIDPRMRGVIEPVLEDFSFITPRDAGSPFYAVSVKYRLNGYNKSGQLFESWTFTGYGSLPAPAMPSPGADILRQATALAMRDAGAKMAAEFREQAVVRGLLPSGETAAPQGSSAPAAPAPQGTEPAPTGDAQAPAQGATTAPSAPEAPAEVPETSPEAESETQPPPGP